MSGFQRHPVRGLRPSAKPTLVPSNAINRCRPNRAYQIVITYRSNICVNPNTGLARLGQGEIVC